MYRRRESIGKPKAFVAAETIRKYESGDKINIVPIFAKVSSHLEAGTLNDSFWENIDIVVSAVVRFPLSCHKLLKRLYRIM